MSRVLNSSPRIEVIGSASNGAEAVTKSEDLRPDLVIMDVEMPRKYKVHSVNLILRRPV